jgi:YVTN family beta-propeller protein
MRSLMSARWRHEHRRALRVLTAAGGSVALLAGLGTAALAAGSSGSGSSFGNEQVGGTYANGVLLPTQQWVKPAGTRVLVDQNGRLLSSSISPNGQYLAALTWNDFTGWLTVINVKTGQIIQQVGTGTGTDTVIGDGTVAADGPLWSADGTSLWFPQTSDLVHFTVAPNGTVSSPVVIPLSTTIVNLTTGDTTVPDGPSGMALSPDGKRLYVALNVVNKLGVIDTASNKLVKVINVGNAPRQVVLAGQDAFVSNEGGRPARPGDYTNNSAGTNIVASKVTGGASTGTVSEVSLATGRPVRTIRVGVEPSAEYLAADGTLMVANSNNDSISLISTKTGVVEQTVNVNPLPGTTVGSNPNAITMPDASTVLVSIGRDNALAVYGYRGPRTPLQYEGLVPTDFYPVSAQYDAALGKIVVTNDKGIGARGLAKTINKGPGTAPGAQSVTGPNTYSDTGSVTEFSPPGTAALAGYTHQVFVNNNWEHLLASTPLQNCAAPAVAIPTRLGCPSTIKHVFLIVRENRTYDQDLGDIGKGNGQASYAQFGATITPNAHKLATSYGLFDNFYDEGTLSADGHNWLMQADANDYIEKEFGAFYRSYPAQGGDALAYQRDGFLWNAAAAAGQSVKAYGEYNNFITQPAKTTWSQYYQDSQILEGKATGPLPVPVSATRTYADIPSLNKIDDHAFPAFDLNIPDQYRTDIWQQSFRQQRKAGKVPNLSLIWMPDDHTAGIGTGAPNPVAEVADNDLGVGRIIDTISHSSIWKSSVVFVVEDDTQNGIDHVDGHRGPLLIASPYAQRGLVDSSYYTQLNVVRTIEQIEGIAPMNQEDRAAWPMYSAFTSKPDFAPYHVVPNQIPLTQGLTAASSASRAAPAFTPASPAQQAVPAAVRPVYEDWVVWSRNGRFTGPHAIQDFANPAQLNRLDWYSAHGWKVPYPGDRKILPPTAVPGHNLPADYLGD